MKSRSLAVLLAVLLSACAVRAEGVGTGPDGEAAFLSVVGTPFLIAFKVPACVATVLVAAPAVGASAMIPREDNPQQGMARQIFAKGVRDNCGPPYVVTPP